MTHFADRLAEAIRQKGNAVCVGLDPRWESLPTTLREKHGTERKAEAYEAFCSRVLDIVAPLVPIVKPQAAFFEALGPAGFTVLQRLLAKARALGVLTILDGKRNDIASTATAYADAAFHVWGADSLTINGYLGRDAVEPFLASARKVGGGVFVLVRTSNAGAGQFQDLVCEGKPVYQHVGAAVTAWARENLGACGLGDVGAVVGATHPRELALLRGAMEPVIFLVPGYGAQGGTAADVLPAFRMDGLGAVVNSSRGILFPYRPEERDWEAKIEQATRETITALAFSGKSE